MKPHAIRRILATAAFAALASAAAAESILIEGARLFPISSPPIEKGDILIVDGKIAQIGKFKPDAKPDRVIKADGKRVYPGLFAGFTQLGLVEVSQVRAVNDADERTGMNTAQVAAVDSYNPQSSVVGVTRVNGVTTVLTAPSGGNAITGQSAVMILDGETVTQTTVKSPAALMVTLGEAPKGRGDSRNSLPSTRMGTAAYLRGEFQRAREYADKWERHARAVEKHEREIAAFPKKIEEWKAKAEKDRGKEPEPPEPPSPPDRNLQRDAMLPALRGEIPTAFEVYRLDDIDFALRLSAEFGLRPVLIGATDAWKIAPKLAEAKVPCILTPTDQPDSMERLGAIYENAAKLHAAGVPVAFTTNDTTHNVRNLPYEAAIAIRAGLPADIGLRAITLTPAEIWGVADRLGSLDRGKDATLIVTSGDPLEPRTTIDHVFIGGKEMPKTNRQTQLAHEHGKDYVPAVVP